MVRDGIQNPNFYIAAMAAGLTFVIIAMSGCRESSRPVSEGMTIDLPDVFTVGKDADTIRLGRIHSGERVVREFVLRNTGKHPFAIVDIRTTCGCTVFEYDKKPLKPGEYLPVTLEFDSEGYSGWTVKEAWLRTSLPEGTFRVVVEAEVY